MISFRILANLLTGKKFPKIMLMGFFFLTATGCLNDNKIVGERQEIYADPLASSLSNKGKNINLGKPRAISSITQVDNGPTHHFIHSSFNGLLSKAWETSVLRSGNLSAPIITLFFSVQQRGACCTLGSSGGGRSGGEVVGASLDASS